MSLSRSGQAELYPAILRRLNELAIDPMPRSEKLIALQAYSLCLTPGIVATEHELLSAIREKLAPMYPNRSYLVNRSLSDLLVRAKATNVVAKTIRLMNSTTDQTEQMHYLYVLRAVQNGWNVADRTSYFTALAQSRNYLGGAGMNDFINKIREEAIGGLSDSERETLGVIIEDQQGQQQRDEVKPRPFVQKWSVEAIETMSDATDKNGLRDVQRGKRMFSAAACIQCHRIAGRGTLVGPDLTAASRRFSRRDLLTSILEPSNVIAENYRSVQIVTSDGKTYTGQAVLGGDYRSPLLRLATDPSQPFKTIEIDKAAIEIQQTSPVSWMPEGLLDTLTLDEILDLVAYIELAESTDR